MQHSVAVDYARHGKIQGRELKKRPNRVVKGSNFALLMGLKGFQSCFTSFLYFLGKDAEAEDHTASFAQEMMNNFVDDLNFYLERAPEMRRELLMYF